jgi:hypothetical protein
MRLMDGMALAGYRALHVLCSSFLCLFLSFVAFKPRTLITGNTPEKAASHSSRLSVFLEIPTLVLILVPLVPTAFVSTPIFLDLLPWVAQNQVCKHAGFTLWVSTDGVRAVCGFPHDHTAPRAGDSL